MLIGFGLPGPMARFARQAELPPQGSHHAADPWPRPASRAARTPGSRDPVVRNCADVFYRRWSPTEKMVRIADPYEVSVGCQAVSAFFCAAASGRSTASIVFRWARRGPKRSTKSLEREVPLDEVLVVLVDVAGEVRHQGRVDCLELSGGLLAVLGITPSWLVCHRSSSAIQRRDLLVAGDPFVASRANLSCCLWFSRTCCWTSRVCDWSETDRMEQDDRVGRSGRHSRRAPWPGRGHFHPICPGRRRVLVRR